MTKLTRFSALTAGVLIAAGTARADLTFTLTQGNTGGGGLAPYPGPYATVDLHIIDAHDLQVTVTADTVVSGGNTYSYSVGGQGTVGLNITGAGIGLGTVTATTLGGGTPTYSLEGSGNEDGFGTFDFRLRTSDGYGSSTKLLTFTISNTDGAWTSDAALLSGGNFPAASHVFVTQNGADAAVQTGFATTPEPSTLIAGALLLLPFGASTLRILRNRKS